MRKYHKWVLTLGIMVAAPGISSAGPFPALFSGNNAATPAKQTSNQQVAERIAAALRSENMHRYNIEIEYKRGVASLGGQVATEAEKHKITKIVASVPGVRAVDNRLAAPSAANRFAVTRRGQSPSAGPAPQGPNSRSPIQQADAVASGNPFVKQIGFDQSKTTAKPVSNQKVAENIARALGKANFKGYDIEVRFSNGVAVLGGEIGTQEQWQLAAEVAQSVDGVQHVENRMKIAQGNSPQQGGVQPVAYQQPNGYPQVAYQQPNGYPPSPVQGPAGGMMPVGGGMSPPPSYGHPGQSASHMTYDSPNLPEYAWPSYAQYPNYSQVSYPSEYSASAWPYIGPFYPYPQVPLGWRQAQLEWDDGSWNLNLSPRTDRWWWFLDPKNW